jgi:hypothetical protein
MRPHRDRCVREYYRMPPPASVAPKWIDGGAICPVLKRNIETA